MKSKHFSHKLLVFIFLFIFISSFAQKTGIGTVKPDLSSSLEIKSDNSGVLIPRVSGLTNDPENTAIKNPANGLLVYDTDKQCLSQNIGTSEKPDWVCISGNIVRFFYMPSLALDITQPEKSINVDLYSEYVKQFSLKTNSTTRSSTKSPSAPDQISFFGSPEDLYYYVTSYSKAVFEEVKVSDRGVLTYKVKKDAVINSDSGDFMNIVFVMK